MKRLCLISISTLCALSMQAQTYTGYFYSPGAQGMRTDDWFNLVPQAGTQSYNNWNIYHRDGSSLFSVNFGATQPSIVVGASRATDLNVKGNILQNLENSAFGVDTQANARLGIIKKTGAYPTIASDNASPIIFSQTNQAGIFTNISGATLTERMRIDVNGNVGIGTPTPSNTQGWDKVLNIDGASNSKMIASSSGQNFRTGVYSHSSMNGGGGFIGTETNHKLFFMTNYTTQATLDVNGYLGIGVTSPSSMVHINSAVARNSFRIYLNTSTSNYLNIWQGSGAAALDPIGTGKLYLGYDQITDTYVNGRLGIGTTSPDYPLTVNGSIHAKEVRVDLSVPGPDYVFERDYKLTSLEDIKNYIDQNKHLPEVPTAEEMEKNGVQLGEMNLILLKKIEELTLHVIEQNKRLTNLEQENRELKNLIKK